MTKFNKDQFEYHGGYLMYHGDYEGCPVYEGDNVHPTRLGKRRPLFVARFKHRGPITKAKFMKQLFKDGISVEEYAEQSKEKPPLMILRDRDPVWFQTTTEAHFAKMR